MNPLVSIIIPCYNQDKFIVETIDSVLKQTYEFWECIIVDDGSTDNSSRIIKNKIKEDTRFKYILKSNEGVSKARNVGIENANGQYLQFLDADDILAPEKLELSLHEIKKSDNTLKIVITNFQTLSHDSAHVFPPFCELKESYFSVEGFLTQWNVSFSIQMQCGFFDTSLFKSVRFPENLSAQEDWVVWVQLFKIDNQFVFIDQPLAYYRKNPESRMMTIGIDDNQLKVVDVFKNLLTYDEFYIFSSNLISRYYNSDVKYRILLNRVKKSNSYQAGLMIKKVFKTMGVLKPARYFFEKYISHLKAK